MWTGIQNGRHAFMWHALLFQLNTAAKQAKQEKYRQQYVGLRQRSLAMQNQRMMAKLTKSWLV